MGRAPRWIVASLLLLAASCLPSLAEPAAGRQDTVSPNSTLAAEVVTAVYQDRTGFLWVGTREGLIRYDGYTATTFEHDVADPDSISDNAIRVVFEDSAGALWIGTNAGGLDRFDRATGRFRHFRHDSANPRSLSNDSVYSIVEDRDGRLWVATLAGLNRLDVATGLFERFDSKTGGLSHDYVDALLIDHEGALWIATVWGGLDRRDPLDGRIEHFRHDPADSRSIESDSVHALAEDAHGALWVGTSEGINRFDRATRAFQRIEFEKTAGAHPSITSSLVLEPDGTVWAATFDAGLWSLAPGETVFRQHPLSAAGAGRSADRVISLLLDKRGALWAATWGAGLIRLAVGNRLFHTITAGAEGTPTVGADVSSVLEDRLGGLWIGSYGGSFLIRQEPGGAVRPLAGPAPLALWESRTGRIWIGTTVLLRELDPGSGHSRDFRETPGVPGGLGPGWVCALCEDRQGRLWVGTGGGGLHRLREDGTFERFTNDPGNPKSLSDDYVTAILEDRGGTLWVGTRSGGLNALPPDGREFERYVPGNLRADNGSISSLTILALFEDREGRIWIGTGGGGVNRIERPLGEGRARFVHLTEREGLVDDNVVSLAEDDDGSLWIGTRRGISRYAPDSGAVISYGLGDGLPSATFSAGAVAAGRQSLFFGTQHGVVAITRGTPFPKPTASPMLLTAVRALHGSALPDRPAWELGEIAVPYGEILSMEMAVLDFGDRRRHRYSYKLEGLQDEFVDLGTRREITFTRFDPGSYTLRVRGRNDQGVWSEPSVPLRIHIVPPFWMTTWFRAFAVATVGLLALAAHRLRTKALENRNWELVQLKEQRETALDEVRASQRALHGAYERLRGLTRKLEAAKEDERKVIARELHDELGQAISTAKLNLQLLASVPTPVEHDRRVADTIGLLDRMIGLVRTISLDLRPPLLDELGLSVALRGYLEAQERRSGVAIEFDVSGVPARLPEDLQITVFRVVQESVTNVFRHAGASRVEVDLQGNATRLALRVVDDGRGFDLGEALERAAVGRHLGLMGMRERIESMGGTLSIESSPGRGTDIRAQIPLPGLT